jgi:hypothetical protein
MDFLAPLKPFMDRFRLPAEQQQQQPPPAPAPTSASRSPVEQGEGSAEEVDEDAWVREVLRRAGWKGETDAELIREVKRVLEASVAKHVCAGRSRVCVTPAR